MLQGDYLSVLESKNQDQFRSVVVRFAQQLGFETVAATAIVDRLDAGGAEFVSVHNTPLSFETTFDDQLVGKRDPVAQH